MCVIAACLKSAPRTRAYRSTTLSSLDSSRFLSVMALEGFLSLVPPLLLRAAATAAAVAAADCASDIDIVRREAPGERWALRAAFISADPRRLGLTLLL